jgi:membrane-associated phospholipid phosphatase
LSPPFIALRWDRVIAAVTRPYPVSVSMVALVTLVPFYIAISAFNRGRTLHVPAIALDGLIPLAPGWAIVYGALYLFLILLPVFVVHQQEQIRRTVFAYLAVWLTAYVCFLIYPTVAPRPATIAGEGFGVWGLRLLYDADPPRNCFPSLHVAHSFVSALTCYRVHRRVGLFAILCAGLVAMSTLFTKQHYVLDVVGGVLLSGVAYAVFLRPHPRTAVSDPGHQAAPVLAFSGLAIVTLGVTCFWVVYLVVPQG